ncbi:MAG TPA: hypothetical protein VGQ20_12010 [Acidimicrobiales bacterium]|jgi:hypothetical protein|nr:hypothetical protein [Acidimicrobiales bacterium]
MQDTTTPSPASRPPEDGWLPDTPVGDSILRRFVHNQADLNDAHARAAGGRTSRLDGAALADSGGPIAYLNQAVLLRPLSGRDDPTLDGVEEFMGAGRAGATTLLSIWPTPDITTRGWFLVGHPTFVVRGPVAVDPAVPPDVSLRLVSTPDDLAVAERVAVEGYPLEVGRGARPGSLLPAALSGGVQLWTGSHAGEAVGVGAAFVAHGLVNLCLAATLPAARRKGVWGALVDARVAGAPELPAAAFTSDMSRPGFEAKGFLPITRFTLWARG